MRPVTDLQRKVAPFQVITDMVPAGDQPTAIADIERRVRAGDTHTVLLGATGTGKTASVAWIAERLQRPVLVMLPNKTLAAQFANELREMLPNNAVEYFVSYYDYYQPEAYVPQTDTYIEKDSSINARGRAAQALRHQLAAHQAGHHRRVLRVVHLRPGHAAGVRGPDAQGQAGRHHRAGQAAPQAGRHAVQPERPGLHPRHVPGPRRHHRDHPDVRGARRPDRDVRRRDRAADRRCTRSPARSSARTTELYVFPATHYVAGPERMERAINGIEAELAERLGELDQAGQAARGAAAAHAHHLRHRDAPAGRQLLRDRELLAAHRRPRGRHPAEHPARLLPRGLPAGHRRVARDRAADRRHVRGRRVPQAGPGGARLPAAERDRQPAADLGRVPRPDRPDHLPVGHAGPVRAAARRRRRGRAGDPADRAGRPRGRHQADQGPDRRPAARDQAAGRARRAGAGHHADQADGRGPDRLPAGERGPGQVPAQRGRHAAPDRAAARAAGRASTTCWSGSTCSARASTCPRCRSWPSWTRTRRASCARARR